jgi:hypothetical protein
MYRFNNLNDTYFWVYVRYEYFPSEYLSYILFLNLDRGKMKQASIAYRDSKKIKFLRQFNLIYSLILNILKNLMSLVACQRDF